MIRIKQSNDNERRREIASVGTVLVCLSLVVSCGSDRATRPSDVVTDPARAMLVTSDIEHFWSAYDAGGANGGTAAFQTQYLDRASPGLVDFIA